MRALSAVSTIFIFGLALLAAAGLTVAQEQPESSTPNPPTTPTSVASGVPTPTPDPLGTAPQRRRAPDIEPLLAEVRRVHGLG